MARFILTHMVVLGLPALAFSDEPGKNKPLHFTNDILPVLTKHGCNGGACHGKAIGQAGFKLSLFGFDPEQDYAAIVHEGHGRRVSPAAPDDSLILLKATGKLAHGGGVRFGVDSEAYRMLSRWLQQGLPFGAADAPRDVKLEVTPAERIFQAKGKERLRVVVHYSDGSTRDVTKWARYDSQLPEVVTVNVDGLVETTGRPGEGSVLVRYADQVATARFVTLRGAALPEQAYAGFTPNNFIDKLALARWRSLHIAPSPASSDAEFLRRVYLDALGKLPTPKEITDFLADKSPDKRDKLVDKIVDRDEYTDYWAQRMGDLLRNRVGDTNGKDNSIAFAKWIRKSVADNKPYDKFVREILTVTGKIKDQPQLDWYRWAITSDNRVEDTAQAFLGLRVSCANCHNHPFENIRQSDYWQFAAFFARIKLTGDTVISELKVMDEGGIKHPRSGEAMLPKAFRGPQFDFVKGQDPRHKLVDWMTAKDNPYFARAIVNRVWGHYMGVGLIDPVDDMRASNPASNPELLDALARDFIEHQFDLKHLAKTIMKSRIYGLSSAPTADNKDDKRNYARYYSRRMPPHVLLDAVSDVTGVAPSFRDYADIKRAVKLPNEQGASDFLDMFGRSRRTTPCECETSLAPNLPQVLYLMNSDDLQRKISDKNGTIAQLAKPGKSTQQAVEDLFLRTFSRWPRPAELQKATALIEQSANRREALEDVLWALFNSNEFLFNH